MTEIRLIPAHAGKIGCPDKRSSCSRAHPRSRGENIVLENRFGMGEGSSPLTRGKSRVYRFIVLSPGLIPAHAGKIPRHPALVSRRSAHPRSRGENAYFDYVASIDEGSSPLTRGKCCARGRRGARHGLIPAHAGKMRRATTIGSHAGAHPRSRGENFVCMDYASHGHGSSPLTRGKFRPAVSARRNHGLIPAHAGKIQWRAANRNIVRAHPRSRGENLAHDVGARLVSGSSPLTRGKSGEAPVAPEAPGLIPAHAGKMLAYVLISGHTWAHPRSRGENENGAPRTSRSQGSSPLTRGKYPRNLAGHTHGGLIPAHAGKMSGAGHLWGAGRAHPRSRGENPDCLWRCHLGVGSSPLTRGKYFLTCAFIAQIGQILESLELCASSETYSLKDVSAIDSLRDRVRSIGLDPLNSTGASSV